jgi:hypothetical protein
VLVLFQARTRRLGAAAGFGVPAEQAGDHAHLAVKGIRDIESGIFTVVLLATQVPHVLAWFLLAAALIPVGDMIVVLRHQGSKATAYGELHDQ